VLRRREVLAGLPAAIVLSAASGAFAAAPFSEDAVRAMARSLAAQPYAPAPVDLPPALAALDYDAYRDLRFSPAKAIWRDLGLPFQLQMFHRGWLHRDQVQVFEVVDGQESPILYSPDLFSVGRNRLGPLSPDLGFAGFRIHTPMAVPGRFDEVAAFLGASYFRAVSRGTSYGLSARGLAVGAGEDGEEFPVFRSFWIERPAPDASALVVHALLDSVSIAGAYRFVITPGEPTGFDVTASLFPRTKVANAGIAPLTSMYLFGDEEARRFDDFRPQVHDSDGLLIANGQGERLWRPLTNPMAVETSAFQDPAPAGFGLMQRARAFSAYQDLEARYDLRPSLWVQPVAGFGQGDVRLSELPARNETEDNVVACWRPGQSLAAGIERRFAYRLAWGRRPAPAEPRATVGFWRIGQAAPWRTAAAIAAAPARRRVVIDFTSAPDMPANAVQADVTASAGGVSHVVVEANRAVQGFRVSFEFEPGAATVSELRAALFGDAQPISEVWTHRWLA
jgi:glucans biosynthesis protein